MSNIHNFFLVIFEFQLGIFIRKESYNSCYCEALCYFSDINNVHNVVSTFLFYVILFFSTGQFPSGQFASYKLSLVEFFFGKVLF